MMQSQIILPSEALRPIVHHYWVMQADASFRMELKIMPMGCMKWMFHRGKPFMVNGLFDHPASICGQYASAAHVGLHGHTDLLFVFFQPYAMKMITGIPSEHFNDSSVGMDELDMPEFNELEQQVLQAPDNQTAIMRIEQFILRQLHCRDDAAYLKQFTTLIRTMELHPDISLSAMADSVCLSERQLRRVFSEYIGLSPKQMLRIRRCLTASRMMQQMEGAEFTDIIYQLGFTDHSHLYKEFKLFAGLSPTDYLSHLRQIRSEHLLAGYRAYHG